MYRLSLIFLKCKRLYTLSGEPEIFFVILFPFLDALYLPTSGTAKEEAAQEVPDCLVKYFSVVWCKASKKKHEKWEGDAILITKGKSVILKDMEGKDIGRGTVELHTCSREHLAENCCTLNNRDPAL